MAEFKLVIGTKDGKCVQKEVKETDADIFLNKKIGDKISGDACGLAGYEFEITGGSDHCGFPMRRDVSGLGRKRILAVAGIGLLNKKKKRGRDQKGKRTMKGMRSRKTVCGNTIHANTAQINLKVLKEGKAPLAAKEEKKEEKAAPAEGEKKAEPKKETPKEEPKKAEPKKEEKPKEEKKEAPKEAPKEEKPKEEKPAEKKE
jgi:small subunit ribosomal protein S6e